VSFASAQKNPMRLSTYGRAGGGIKERVSVNTLRRPTRFVTARSPEFVSGDHFFLWGERQLEEDDDMPAARPEFTHLSEADVWAAVDSDDGPIAAEVTRLVAEHTIRLKACAARNAAAPGVLLKVRTRCPIERVAVFMMAEAGVSLVTVN
jgi:hypothetical protein